MISPVRTTRYQAALAQRVPEVLVVRSQAALVERWVPVGRYQAVLVERRVAGKPALRYQAALVQRVPGVPSVHY
jgi:hypothetical protein